MMQTTLSCRLIRRYLFTYETPVSAEEVDALLRSGTQGVTVWRVLRKGVTRDMDVLSPHRVQQGPNMKHILQHTTLSWLHYK